MSGLLVSLKWNPGASPCPLHNPCPATAVQLLVLWLSQYVCLYMHDYVCDVCMYVCDVCVMYVMYVCM